MIRQWHVVEAEEAYRITDLHTGGVSAFSGEKLAKALPLSLHEFREAVLRLAVSKQ